MIPLLALEYQHVFVTFVDVLGHAGSGGVAQQRSRGARGLVSVELRDLDAGPERNEVRLLT